MKFSAKSSVKLKRLGSLKAKQKSTQNWHWHWDYCIISSWLFIKKFSCLSSIILAEIDEFSSTTYESIGDGTNNNNNASSSPESSDDFVLVPNNLPAVDAQAYERKYVWLKYSDEISH
jgi:hypothetical protein